MHDGMTPQGQMELRLEAFQDTSLTDLKVEPCSTVTARYVFDDGDYYEFTVSPGGANGTPVFSWHAVTFGDLDIYTRSREHIGPTRTLADLLTLGESDGPLGNFWRDDALALIGLHDVAAAAIQESIDDAMQEAAEAASERLTRRFQQPAEAPPIPDVDECFEAFQAACQQRAPYCDGIELSWDKFDELPGVAFGLAPGTPEQILFEAEPNRAEQLYLNGFWTGEACLEDDLLEQFPDDAWARLGARNAARDLVAIQRTAFKLMQAKQQDILQQVDSEKRDRLFGSVRDGSPVDTDWDGYTAGRVQAGYLDLFEKVKEYLNGLKPKRTQKPGADPSRGAGAATKSLT